MLLNILLCWFKCRQGQGVHDHGAGLIYTPSQQETQFNFIFCSADTVWGRKKRQMKFVEQISPPARELGEVDQGVRSQPCLLDITVMILHLHALRRTYHAAHFN